MHYHHSLAGRRFVVNHLLLFLSTVYKLIITDSIGKNVSRVRNTRVHALPGYTIARTTDAIVFGNIQVSHFKAILIHMGTNDIPAKRDRHSGRQSVQPIKQVVRAYKAMIDVIRRSNPGCKIVVSAIIPRPVDFPTSKYRVERVNQGLQQLCESSSRLIFNPTHKFFLKKGLPVLDYYAPSDRLHLRGAGVARLQQAFQQALSDVNLAKENHWRRRPSSGIEHTSRQQGYKVPPAATLSGNRPGSHSSALLAPKHLPKQ